MTGDITSLQPTTAAAALVRAGLSPTQVLTLLQPMENLLPPGETVDAEVVTLKQLNQSFQLLLSLATSNGGKTSVQVESALPFTPGTSLSVSQASSNTLTLTLQQINTALNNSQTSIDIKQLPVGTLLQGRVLTTQMSNDALSQMSGDAASRPNVQPGAQLTQPALYRSMVLLLNTALAGTTLTIESPQPLTTGTLLSAQVQGRQALSFVPMPSRLDQLALSQQLTTQQNRQGSLDVLINALRNLPASSPAISAPLQASINQLLADLPDVEQMTNPKTVAQAISASGLFMEAKLLTGLNPMDLKANLMRVIQQILPGLPGGPGYDAAAASNMLTRSMPGALRSVLGTMGLVAGPALPIHFPLPSRSVKGGGKEDDLEMLLKLAAAAVSRLQSHQLGGLEQTRTTADGGQLTTWQLEIPMRNAHDIVPLQVKVQREDTPEKDKSTDKDKDENEVGESREKLWKIDLAFDLAPLGPLQVHAQLIRGNLSSQLWAERADSAELISRELGHLRERLVACGLTVGSLECRQGTPPQGARTTLERRWIDENA
ncbi:MAG TPA: flagellar hook-length control protein FliK [Pseudomonas sp.]|jgi:hypothetical protein|uniref:flagellar hook-length control protein FliK n=1 Tax=Pseudomonas sp. TaxID=306 RepID=UPI002EDB7936